jgi:hypothetical protein
VKTLEYYTPDQIADIALHYGSKTGGLEEVQAGLGKKVTRGLDVAKVSKDAHCQFTTLSTTIEELVGLAKDAENSLQACRHAALSECAHNPVFNHEEAIAAIDKHTKRAAYFHEVVDFARRHEVPRLLLRTLEADAALAMAHCSIASERALVSAIERFQASLPLLEAEGLVEFSPLVGRTGVLLEESRRAFQIAKDA